jgi:hypothetical protein
MPGIVNFVARTLVGRHTLVGREHNLTITNVTCAGRVCVVNCSYSLPSHLTHTVLLLDLNICYLIDRFLIAVWLCFNTVLFSTLSNVIIIYEEYNSPEL